MVQLHSYVPASSTPQKLANWGHLNRKVLSKLNFSIPGDVIQQVVQCRPGTVEQVLLLLRQKIDEKQRQNKVVPGPGQEWGVRAALEGVSYLETGEPCATRAVVCGAACGGAVCMCFPRRHYCPPAAGREGAGPTPGA
ncbi:SPEF1 protein, partial [Alca torda]|nr:SPEF1 protein [Alca torda]